MSSSIEVVCAIHKRNPSGTLAHDPECECGAEKGVLMGMTLTCTRMIGRALWCTFGEENLEFEVFFKILCLPTAEMTLLSTEDRDLWLLEVEQLISYLIQNPPMLWDSQKRWDTFWKQSGGWSGSIPVTKADRCDIDETLEDICDLCNASKEKNRIIEIWT